jgi:hypothetical protein
VNTATIDTSLQLPVSYSDIDYFGHIIRSSKTSYFWFSNFEGKKENSVGGIERPVLKLL